MNKLRSMIYLSIVISFFMQSEVFGGIIDTKHNFSITGPGPIKSTTEDRICFFCHAPDRSRRRSDSLWNRRYSRVRYIPYQSSTLYARVGQPTGSSKLCLSCHDGTIALGELLSERYEIPFAGGIRFLPEGPARLGTDLSDDHPISFVYDSQLATTNGELADPMALPSRVKLDRERQLQCTTCHNPHNNDYGKFLVMPNYFSQLCTVCHRKNGWNGASHAVSTRSWNGSAPDPWPHTPYTTVSENGCENCHMSHNAGGPERLLNYSFEEDNCLVCHGGSTAGKNVEREFTKQYTHAIEDYSGIHDPAEDFLLDNVQKHVECTDCHNPHWANADPSPGAPQVSGAVRGIKGIDLSGQTVPVSVNQYEICFKCHADNYVTTSVPIDRDIQQLNTRLEFSPSNPSFHPVISRGVNENVPSLILPYTTSSIIFCTDCHNNNDAVGPKGPHGSINKYLLEENYTTQDYTQESPYNYALCYKCHERESILGDESFSGHNLHIVQESTPCSACHDSHGISSTQGDDMNNSNLINFDLTIVQPDSMGRLLYEDTGLFSGQCFLSCHGSAHEPEVYPPVQ